MSRSLTLAFLILGLCSLSNGFVLNPNSGDYSKLNDPTPGEGNAPNKLKGADAFAGFIKGVLQGFGVVEEASSLECYSDSEKTFQLHYFVLWSRMVAHNETENATLATRTFVESFGKKLDEMISFRSRFCSYKSADTEAVADKLGINPHSKRFMAALGDFMNFEPAQYRYVMNRISAAFADGNCVLAGRNYANFLKIVGERAGERRRHSNEEGDSDFD